ncbi:RNA 3'-terminal phosphate cyclase domain-containing protein [Fimicolochytrium jonesii]|uniref:RNA 3'-terminal phosphate cyclase domain-containing protein n=1 Tax=Fimicolochytrium jonesii TaxID=1396493 RepID=UPI0022FE9A8D|nr:RNA 3'-terminal phosphate cyclase domain-containing protein [Fimicolochytrium jonesii]KAI8822962.1 RNA 3'-terminal phosphate cyclase domain-containing protein [Fimicolochytrium jonesii]
MVAASVSVLRSTGHQNFRQRVTLAVLSKTSVAITAIRSNDYNGDNFGISDAEVSFLKLVQLVCPGTSFDVLQGGTGVFLRPGPDGVVGGRFEHVCPLDRSAGWFIEPLLVLGMFAREPLTVSFTGVTSHGPQSLSVDTITSVCLPMIRMMGGNANVTVKSRGALMARGGVVEMQTFPSTLLACDIVDDVPISCVTGVAYSYGLPMSFPTQAADAATSLLGRYFQQMDIVVVAEDQPSESTTSSMADGSDAVMSDHHITRIFSHPSPDNVGIRASRLLLQEIRQGGCVDKSVQNFVLMLLALSSPNTNEQQPTAGALRIGALEKETVTCLRDLKAFLEVEFNVQSDAKSRTVVLKKEWTV